MGDKMADAYTQNEIACIIGKTRIAVRKRAAKERWPAQKRQGRGGGWEHPLNALPDDILQAIIHHHSHEQTGALSGRDCLALDCRRSGHEVAELEDGILPAPATLAGWQRRTMDARYQVLNYLDYMAADMPVSRAVNTMVKMARAGTLPDEIMDILPVANARSGGQAGKRSLSTRSLWRWRQLRARGATALAPCERAKHPLPAWAPYFLKCYRKPSKPSVADAIEEMADYLPDNIPLPSQNQAYRMLKKMSAVDRERGRSTGNELLSWLPMRRRSTEDLLPLDVVTCDGHTFKAKVAHPAHGRPFAPEVCAVVDAATRKAIGWSIGLAESAETVADALRHAICSAGIPCIFYTDPGSGNTAHVNSHPAFGRYARIGITFKSGIPGRTQARGLVERFQQSCWIRAAKRLPTYQGKDMDKVALIRTTRQIEKDIKTTGHSDLLMEWDRFRYFCAEEAIAKYNNRPHSKLPKITDPETGLRRHITPNEMWDWHVAQGWQPEAISEQEAADLFRPRVQKRTTRGEVKLFGNIYFAPDLKHHSGADVLVEYEPQDGQFVFVRDLDERLICKAEFNRNKDSYYPKAAIEQAADDRARRRAKLKEMQLEEIEAERQGNNIIEVHQDPAVIEARDRIAAEMAAENTPDPDKVLTIPHDHKGKYRLCRELERRAAEGKDLSDREQQFMRSYQNDVYYRAFRDADENLGGYGRQASGGTRQAK